MITIKPLSDFLSEYVDRNIENKYPPVAVGRYGIRTRESIYSKELAKDYSKNKLIRKNTLTVGMGSNQVDIGILSDDKIYSVSPAYHTYNINGINVDYLRYCLEHRNQDMFIRYAKRGSRQGKTIDFSRWLNYVIPVYSEEIQSKIVIKLNKISFIIRKREELLKLYDQLARSLFIEMFGDVKSNSKKWIKKQFTDIALIDTNMLKNFDNYENYPHIGIDSIEKETGEIIGYRTVQEDKVVSGKYLFTQQHIIYSKIRPNLNKVALPNFNGVCSADAYPILVKNKKCHRVFLAYIMRSKLFLDYIIKLSNRTNLPKVNKKQVEGFICPVPPLDLQNRFAEYVSSIDKSKYSSFSHLSA